MKKLYVLFSEDARNYVDKYGYEKLAKSKKVSKGFDWDIKEFSSQEVMDAYTQGLDDAQGWDETNWCECTIEKDRLMPSHSLNTIEEGIIFFGLDDPL